MNDDIESSEVVEVTDPKKHYLDNIRGPIEESTQVMRYPNRPRTLVKYSVDDATITGPISWNQAYNVNTPRTHTTGRRQGIEELFVNGIEPFPTPVNETVSEAPAVVCGYVEEGRSVVDSETFQRQYGDIFNPESDGYVVVLDSSVEERDGYEVVGPEARIKDVIQPTDIKAVIVGNGPMYDRAVESAKREGIITPVIKLSREESEL